MRRRTMLGALAAAGAMPLLAKSAAPGASPWRDPLDVAATPSPLAAKGALFGLARSAARVVAVGQRGHVVFSDDAGATWQQASVPVSSDLVAVSFPKADAAARAVGWAVGHDGVVLRSVDGGRSWTRQLDGRTLGDVLVAHYEKSGDAKWLAEAKRFAAQGAENPFLDVCFVDAQTGWVVGAFGLVLRTRDGGVHWEPMLHATDNPKALHLYGVARVGSDVFVVGEQGLALRLDGERFVALALPYAGTLFGVTGNERAVVAYGLRGNVVRSSDGGRTWTSVSTGVNVGLTAATIDERGRIVLVSQAGHVLVSTDDGASFAAAKVERPLPAAAVVGAGSGTLVVAGPRGVSTLRLS
nr:YCF48-related protein [Caldimonas sp.]